MVILRAQLTVPSKPGVAPLDHPAMRLDFESPLAGQALDDLQIAQIAVGHPLAQGAAIGLVNPDFPQPNAALARRLQHPFGAGPIIRIGGMHHRRDQQATGIDQPMPLPSFDLFAAIDTTLRTTHFGAVHALGIHHARRRLRVLAPLDLRAHPPTQQVIQLRPDTLFSPLLEVIMHRTSWRKACGQEPPLAPRPQLIGQGIPHGPQIDRPFRPGLRRNLPMRAHQRPLGIRYIRLIDGRGRLDRRPTGAAIELPLPGFLVGVRDRQYT